MKFKKTISVLLLVVLLIGMMVAPCSVSADTQTYVQSYLDEQMEKHNMSGVAYVTKNGKVLCQSARGMANTAESKEMTIDTLFPIGSNSKQFCAVAIFMLKEQGKLSLDDTLSEYFPEYTKAANVTIRHLLTMRSGIRDHLVEGLSTGAYLPDENGTQEENQQLVFDWLYSKNLIFKPGGGYRYSNTNSMLLSLIIEKVSGQEYKEFIKENILVPLGMNNTGFYEDLEDHPDLCENKVPGIVIILDGLLQGCGDVVSNAKDMDKWMTSLREYTLITKESIDEMTTVCTTNVESANGISLGYAHSVKVAGDGGVCHDGLVVTYESGTLTYFEDEFNVFVVTNDSENQQIYMLDLAMEIAAELKNQKLCGDVDADLEVNIKDATMIQKAVAKILELNEGEKLCSDVNSDSDVNIKDATAIQKHIAGINTDLPIETPIV
ncbi:MAG: serine hydrolase [Ruminococcus sp.]|nr:serine hydrolase [Ruminococcus sp.]